MTLTYKQKFNKQYGFNKDESHTLAEVSKITGYKLSGLKTIYSKVKAHIILIQTV